MSTIFYIHGFGGRDNAPDFHVEINRFLRNNKLQFELRTKSWDSFSFDLSVIASNFIKAKSKCAEIAKELIRYLISWDNNQKRIENGYINLNPTSGKSKNNINTAPNSIFSDYLICG